MQTRSRTSPDERALVRLATRQHGVLARWQLLAGGVGAGAISHRLQVGALGRVHRGVYLLAGAVLTVEAREFAAVLACGRSGAHLSHRSAAHRLGLVPYPASYAAVEVTITTGASGSRAGIVVHRSGELAAGERLRLGGLPVTSVRRTLLDLAAEGTTRALERATASALATRRASREGLLAYAQERARRPGSARLRSLLDPSAPPALTRSEAEERLLELVRRSDLPPPLTNFRVGGFELDLLWPAARLAVEVDGYEFHSDRGSFERDRLRDSRLAGLGIQVVRITWRRLVDEPAALVAELSRAHAARSGAPGDP